MNLYFFMTLLFMVVAGLGALDAALTSWTIIPWVNGLRWLRVHFIALGALTEALFGILPLLMAKHANRPRPQTRLDIWLTLNAGILLLLAAIPTVNRSLIFGGGFLIFVSTSLLLHQLYRLRPSTPAEPAVSRKFYLMGLAYFLVGVVVGTGLWLNWNNTLHIQTPIEVHIHANNWGLMSLVFAGLLIDLYPKVMKRPFAWPHSVNPIFWLMSLGAFGLVVGPWISSIPFTALGLIFHLIATTWLLLNVIKPVWGDRSAWATPGLWHLTTAYFWLIFPLMMAPFVIFQVPGIPGNTVEQNAPQALIYGWLLQFGIVIILYFAQRQFQPEAQPQFQGSWLSLVLIHLGGISLWTSIFVGPNGFWHGVAYSLWTVAIVPLAWQLWQLVQPALDGEVQT